MSNRETFTTVASVTARWAKASPKEREQIRGFVANNKCDTGKWWLCMCQNLDTGRVFLSAGLGWDYPGISTEEIRKIVGLPSLGESKPKYTPAKPIRRVQK